ncbi:MAG: transglycosylase SLT domain-containing protein [Muribaculaceae bacterium]|nr:transglycosylase SLT domain-containing protein [Muribaculaceae bacterium]
MRTIRLLFMATIAAAALTACSGNRGDSVGTTRADSTLADSYVFPDTLRAVTLFGPSSYFIYRGEPMGYDYTLLDSLAREKGCVLDLKVARTMSAAVAMLDSGKVDLIAAEVPITRHYQQYVLPCGPENYTTQVLVQPKVHGRPPITEVTDLVGQEVYVEKDSKYLRRLQNLNEEVGGGIIIHEVDGDTLITEDLINMVSDGKIPLTIVDSDIARLNATYYPDLDVGMAVSFPQRASWAVAPDEEGLAAAIDRWFGSERASAINLALMKQYFEKTKFSPTVRFDFSKGYISRYDHLFKKYAPNVGWDWRLMAAQAFVESKFKPNARSWVGARGLMQIMPSTARGYRTPVNRLNNPETSIQVATRLINDLDGYLRAYVPSDKERLKFVIAAYNVGIAHVYDAIRLAQKYGYDPQVWDDNVSKALMMKMNPKYYNDPVVRYGYCRATETVAYVDRITDFYEQARREIHA